MTQLEFHANHILNRTYGESWGKTINCHDSPSYYVVWTLKPERMLSLCWNEYEALPYEWDLKVLIYPYGLGHYWWRLVATNILNKDTIISHGIKTMCLLRWSKRRVHEFMAVVISLVEFDICSLELEYISWSHNKWDLQLEDWWGNWFAWNSSWVI